MEELYKKGYYFTGEPLFILIIYNFIFIFLYLTFAGTLKGNRKETKVVPLPIEKGIFIWAYRHPQSSILKWSDRRVVYFCSSMSSPCEIEQKQRKKRKETEIYNIPKIASVYRKKMGFVDRLDQMMGYYRTQRFSKKWYTPLNFFFLEAAIHNSWVIHSSFYDKKHAKSPKNFRVELAKALLEKGSRKRSQKQTLKDIDDWHLIKKFEKSGHCAECGSTTPYKCHTCEIYLCGGCFFNFHNNK